MKVRATKDGHYAGYYRLGPISDDQQPFAGEVFEIDDRLFPILDIEGKPIHELDENGKKIIGKDSKPRMKMGSWFSPEWMERVSEDTEITYDYPPFQLPVQYRLVKKHAPAAGGVAPQPSSVI